MNELNPDNDSSNKASPFWMRSISFAGLHRILHTLAEYPGGLKPIELNTLIKERKIYITQRGTTPTLTTLYHCRNTLLNIKAVERRAQRLLVNRENPCVRILLTQPSPIDSKLDEASREAFAEMVLQNVECKRFFFDLFMPEETLYSVDKFRTAGSPVTWNRPKASGGPRGPKGQEENFSKIILESDKSNRSLTISSPSELNSILYGLRYWARDELQLIDEFFTENRGSVMYPILTQNVRTAAEDIAGEVISMCSTENEWTTLSIQQLLIICGEQQRHPISHVYAALRWLSEKYFGHVVLIPTSRSFATLTAGFNERRQELELRGYFRDSLGRYISHIRLHKTLRKLHHAYN